MKLEQGQQRIAVSNRPADCAFCRAEIIESEPTAVCDACFSRHHEECWDEHSGCAIYGCGGTRPLVARSGEPERKEAEPDSFFAEFQRAVRPGGLYRDLGNERLTWANRTPSSPPLPRKLWWFAVGTGVVSFWAFLVLMLEISFVFPYYSELFGWLGLMLLLFWRTASLAAVIAGVDRQQLRKRLLLPLILAALPIIGFGIAGLLVIRMATQTIFLNSGERSRFWRLVRMGVKIVPNRLNYIIAILALPCLLWSLTAQHMWVKVIVFVL